MVVICDQNFITILRVHYYDNTGDFFRKIVVLDGSRKLLADEDGVMYVGVIPFLLEDVLAEVTG